MADIETEVLNFLAALNTTHINFLHEGANAVFMQDMSKAMQHVYGGVNEVEDNWLRMSSLGKPIVLQLLKKPSITEELLSLGLYLQDLPSPRTAYTFLLGHFFEAWVKFQLTSHGYNISIPDDGKQHEISYNGIKGHLDIVLDSGFIEVKTMSPTYFDKFLKEQDDSRGYLTQMALYQAASGKNGVWVCLNKATGEVVMVTPKLSELERAVARVNAIVPLMQSINSLHDLEDGDIVAPEGVPEMYKRKPTGKLLMPDSMKYSPYRHLFYDIEYGRNGYRRPTEYIGDYVDGETWTNHKNVSTFLKEWEAGLVTPPTVAEEEE